MHDKAPVQAGAFAFTQRTLVTGSSVNYFQRRIAYFVLLAIGMKFFAPSASWLQIFLFGFFGFAVWRLRSAVFRACFEGLKPAALFYAFDVVCAFVGLECSNLLFDVFRQWVIVALSLALPLISAWRYHKLRNRILEAIARAHAERLQQQNQEAAGQE